MTEEPPDWRKIRAQIKKAGRMMQRPGPNERWTTYVNSEVLRDFKRFAKQQQFDFGDCVTEAIEDWLESRGVETGLDKKR